jgi:hypothetical protein
MSADRNRLQSLLDRLRALELRIPLPHERAILEVARTAVAGEILTLTRRLHGNDYWQAAARRTATA